MMMSFTYEDDSGFKFCKVDNVEMTQNYMDFLNTWVKICKFVGKEKTDEERKRIDIYNKDIDKFGEQLWKEKDGKNKFLHALDSLNSIINKDGICVEPVIEDDVLVEFKLMYLKDSEWFKTENYHFSCAVENVFNSDILEVEDD